MDKAEQLGLYIGSFFDELIRLGVRDVVVSPGSRSTPLAMVAHEAHKRFGATFRLYVDVDERGTCKGKWPRGSAYVHIGNCGGKLLSCGS